MEYRNLSDTTIAYAILEIESTFTWEDNVKLWKSTAQDGC